ncbi:dolichol-phosphate mannosyltransferase subunit 3 [Kalaharituber pfeilii]|nr:dolichol-phosphate mannosyltransferase subunit 3 [Kalaharituber pfeilii]
MTRATQTISAGLLLSSLYLSLYLNLIPLSETMQMEIIPILPLWALVSFGAYLLFSLGWGILTFKDTQEAYAELMQEIDQAKAELRVKGVSVD